MGIRIRISRQTFTLLTALLDEPSEWRYGYDLSRQTGLKSGTLYPILMRLSAGNWLETRWEDSPESGRPPRHMYRLNGDGRRWAKQELAAAPAFSMKTAAAEGR
jgi:DNA-binding PadR family transcriptional regulator